MRRSRFCCKRVCEWQKIGHLQSVTGAHTEICYLFSISGKSSRQWKWKTKVIMRLWWVVWMLKMHSSKWNNRTPSWWIFKTTRVSTSEMRMTFEFYSEQPCLVKNQHATILIHVDDNHVCWQKVLLGEYFSQRHEWEVFSEELGSQRYVFEKENRWDGWMVDAYALTSVEKIVKAFESAFGRKQKVPCDSSIQLLDESEKLNSKDSSSYRSIIGLCLYVSRERPDLMFTIKELASSMAAPTLTSVQRLRKLIGYMKHVGDLALRLDVPMPGQGKCFSDGGTTWILESFSDADWSSNKDHRKSTSCGMHYLNNAFVFGSSRSQRTISPSSCESALHSIVSVMCDGIFIVATCSPHWQFFSRVDCITWRLWTPEKCVRKDIVDSTENHWQICDWNVADIGTKCLQQKRLFLLMYESGLVYVNTFESVGEQEYQDQAEKTGHRHQLQKLTKVIMRLTVAMGLEPLGVMGQQCDGSPTVPESDVTSWRFWMFGMMFILLLGLVMVAVFARRRWKSLVEDVDSIRQQLGDHYEYAAWLCESLDNLNWLVNDGPGLAERLNELHVRFTIFEENLRENFAVLDDETDCIRYGLMEYGGRKKHSADKCSANSHVHSRTSQFRHLESSSEHGWWAWWKCRGGIPCGWWRDWFNNWRDDIAGIYERSPKGSFGPGPLLWCLAGAAGHHDSPESWMPVPDPVQPECQCPLWLLFEEFSKGSIYTQGIVDVNTWLTFTKGMWAIWTEWCRATIFEDFCESFEKMIGQCLTENVAEAGKQNSERYAHTFEEEYESFAVVLICKDDSTNREWNVQTLDMKTMSMTFARQAFCGPKQRALPAVCSQFEFYDDELLATDGSNTDESVELAKMMGQLTFPFSSKEPELSDAELTKLDALADRVELHRLEKLAVLQSPVRTPRCSVQGSYALGGRSTTARAIQFGCGGRGLLPKSLLGLNLSVRASSLLQVEASFQGSFQPSFLRWRKTMMQFLRVWMFVTPSSRCCRRNPLWCIQQFSVVWPEALLWGRYFQASEMDHFCGTRPSLLFWKRIWTLRGTRHTHVCWRQRTIHAWWWFTLMIFSLLVCWWVSKGLWHLNAVHRTALRWNRLPEEASCASPGWQTHHPYAPQTCATTVLFAGTECQEPEQEKPSACRHWPGGQVWRSFLRWCNHFQDVRWNFDVFGKRSSSLPSRHEMEPFSQCLSGLTGSGISQHTTPSRRRRTKRCWGIWSPTWPATHQFRCLWSGVEGHLAFTMPTRMSSSQRIHRLWLGFSSSDSTKCQLLLHFLWWTHDFPRISKAEGGKP